MIPNRSACGLPGGGLLDMRLIGHFGDRGMAERASVVFASSGIGHELESDDARGWGLWVLAEDEVERARALYQAFLQAPDDPRFGIATVGTASAGAGSASVAGRPPARQREATVPSDAQPSGERVSPGGPGLGQATLVLTALCVGVALLTGLGEQREWVGRLQMAGLPYRWGAAWDLFLPEVRSGQFWRLWTPMLLHFGWPHIVFNLMAFWGLGHAIEHRRGTPALVGLVAGLALVSNLGQYLSRGPMFGGLSGVVYGLLGYVWMLGRYRPKAGLMLQPQVVVMMLVWFAICLNGSLDTPYGRGADGLFRPGQGVANMAHGVGLLAGVLWGRWVAWKEGERERGQAGAERGTL